MKIFRNTNILKRYKGSTIAIGNFDGVHKGHQKVFKQARKFSRKNKNIDSYEKLKIIKKSKTAVRSCKFSAREARRKF